MNKVNSEKASRISALHFDYETQSKLYISNCNLCNGMEFTIISHNDRYGYSAQAYLCNNCGLIMLNPRMTKDAYTEFYKHIYRPLVSAFHGRLINAITIKDEQLQYALQLGEFLKPLIYSNKFEYLLDIGGSTGVVSEYLLNTFGFKATVLDPAPDELANAKKLGMKVIAGFLEDYQVEEDRRYDLIILCQTIDHLLDINASLMKVKQLLHPSGMFFVDIVDFRAAYLRNQSIENAVKIDHPFYLVEFTMEAYLKRTGFKVLRKNYAPDHLHIGYICCHEKPQQDFLPDSNEIKLMSYEIRKIQNQRLMK